MIELRDVASVRRAESAAFARVPDGALMQRAAFALSVTCAGLLAGARGQTVGSRVVLLVGAGDNGGDALWAGAFLAGRGCAVTAILTADRHHIEGARALQRAGGRIVPAADADAALALLADADLVVDGVLGIGGRGALREPAATLAAATGDAIVVAVDLPSGVDADTGTVAGAAIDADVTVTFGAVKPGLLVGPGRQRSGTVRLVEIGLDFDHPPTARCVEGVDVEAWVPEPEAAAYKYSRGVAALATGSPAYPGAGLLSVAAARAVGAGMVRFLDDGTGRSGQVVDRFPDVVVDGAAPVDQPRATGWGVGSGIAGTDDQEPLVCAVLAVAVPVVLDAGALTIMSNSAAVRELVRDRAEHGLTTVLTPHDGEFERLCPGLLAEADGRLDAARAAAGRLGAVVLLKGPGTVVAAPDGSTYVDTEGTADLGVAGSGDVLTGLLTGVLAGAWAAGRRSLDELTQATAAAVWLHGRAGRIAAQAGPVVAPGIADAVGAAVRAARFGDPS
jgi:hydroxyethylthiazole kinase-like uncharacterized protein yjeF